MTVGHIFLFVEEAHVVLILSERKLSSSVSQSSSGPLLYQPLDLACRRRVSSNWLLSSLTTTFICLAPTIDPSRINQEIYCVEKPSATLIRHMQNFDASVQGSSGRILVTTFSRAAVSNHSNACFLSHSPHPSRHY